MPSSAEELKRLRAELKRVEQERASLKKVVPIFAQPLQLWSRYQFIEQAAATEPVQVLCRVLHVSAAG